MPSGREEQGYNGDGLYEIVFSHNLPTCWQHTGFDKQIKCPYTNRESISLVPLPFVVIFTSDTPDQVRTYLKTRFEFQIRKLTWRPRNVSKYLRVPEMYHVLLSCVLGTSLTTLPRYVASNDGMIVNNKLDRMWKEISVT
jgi:hypothetical protein